MERDGGLCTCPGCSKAADHVHHITYRSRGGGDEDWNLTCLCQAHHLHGVHDGYVRVRGAAPDGLEWELGERR
jgi:5-methylcytosine-specific restriction endonuclease McrA